MKCMGERVTSKGHKKGTKIKKNMSLTGTAPKIVKKKIGMFFQIILYVTAVKQGIHKI